MKILKEYMSKDFPHIKHTFWSKEAKTPPVGEYNKIGVHRLVNENCSKLVSAILVLPGTWSSGEQLSSNEDRWSRNENVDEPFFWANRCIDVYLMDYRTHFVPIEKDSSELEFMINWGWEQWINDIKEVVDFVKDISSNQKIFLVGESFGGLASINYATQFQDDLNGLILLDGGPVIRQPSNSLNFNELLEEMRRKKSWVMEVGGGKGALFLFKYIDENPLANPINPLTGEALSPPINPITGEKWNNILEWATFILYIAWGPGMLTNVYEGFNDPKVLIHTMATFDRYWTSRIYLETQAMLDWEECPYTKYDFDNLYSNIKIPILDVISRFGISIGRLTNNPLIGSTSRSYNLITLDKYGHLDVYNGTYSKRDVAIPVLSWIYSKAYNV
ncbi:alpha/beta hydrolase [Sulfolobus sp. A20-N-F8]|nr:alpha/beta hydrolase [Sulfolobus sp. A20-N-F8]